MHTTHTVPPPRRRRWTMGVRSLMLLVVMLALWLGWKTEKARAQRRAFDGFHKTLADSIFVGSEFAYDYEVYDYNTCVHNGYEQNALFMKDFNSTRSSPVRRVSIWIADHMGQEYAGDITRVELRLNSTRKIDDNALSQLGGLHCLEALVVKGRMKPAGAKRIRRQKNHPEWEKKYLQNWITNERLTQLNLEGNPRLLCLDLSGNPITDAGLVHLESLRRLRILDLSSTLVTGEGLAHLRGLRDLEELILNNTDIDDAGLAHLEGLTKLRSVALRKTRVSSTAIQSLKRKLPGLDLH